MKTLPMLCLSFLFYASPTVAADAPAKSQAGPDAPAGKSHVYKHSAGKPREMEIYFPPNHEPAKAKVPGLLMFHGGAWSGGNLSQFRSLCQYLAGRGIVAATANYRMLDAGEAKQLAPGESRKRVCVTDAKSALRWFRQHAGELGIDPRKIIVGGGSAGGHIAVLATNNAGLNDQADPGNVDTQVAAYLLFNPAFAPDDDMDAEVDVLKQIKPEFAPALVMFGTNDGWKKGWDALHAQLLKQGTNTTELLIAAGQAHGFFNREPWLTVTTIAADRFLAQQGLLSGEPTLAPPSTGEKLAPAGAP